MGTLTRDTRLTWAWIAIALTPVGVGLAFLLTQATDTTFPEARLVASVIAAVIALIPPTVAVVLGFLEGDRVSGRVALALGSALLACVGFALIAYVDSVIALVMATYAYAIAMVAVLAFAQSVGRRRGSGRSTYPLA